ncbi:hepcidin-like [Perca fluviatilis]|uniref:hepcidin-like n=1 Tax=Perca fluviatilis TaxID=8168 RepID=UPI001962DB7C|nr:hepcidin-like [Perca fluviatilis]
MKTFYGVAVAVAVVLTFVCIQQSSAVPATEVQELEEPMTTENPVAEYEATSVDSWKMPYKIRNKRFISCRWCCSCCNPAFCGVCCSF